MPTKKRIAILCPGVGIVERGVEGYVTRFKEYLKNEYDIDIFSYKTTKDSIGVPLSKFEKFFYFHFNPIKKENRITHLINGGYNIINGIILSYLFGIKVFRKIKKSGKKYDLIYDSSGLGSQLLCNVYRKRTCTPFIITDHSGDKVAFLSLLTKPNAFIALKKESLKRIKRQTKNFKINTKGVKILVIPNGVDSRPFEKHKKKNILKKVSHPIILSTSALDNSKRLHLLIVAVAKMKKGTLVMTGKGSLKEKLLSLGREVLGDRFRYLGVLSYNKLINLYYSCDVFSLPSENENFSTSILEAMMANKSVVTQKDSERKRIVGKAGYCIECTDIKKYAHYLMKAYETNFGDEPKKQALKYDWEKTIGAYKKLINNLILF